MTLATYASEERDMEVTADTTVFPKATIGPRARVLALPSFSLSNLVDDSENEIILDYGLCEGGVPVFQIESASGPDSMQRVPFRVTYSETRAGIDHEKGRSAQGPFYFLKTIHVL